MVIKMNRREFKWNEIWFQSKIVIVQEEIWDILRSVCRNTYACPVAILLLKKKKKKSATKRCESPKTNINSKMSSSFERMLVQSHKLRPDMQRRWIYMMT